ncbi:MAG: hypothetical protein KJ587_07215 [Alphaproteobacteria bacterium]|nr:hypothetical protein [Alphaproteobacteria bacterium]
MTFNLNKYLPELEEFDLSPEQKTAMLEALWSVAEAVADLAHGVHATQLLPSANDNDSLCNNNVIDFFELARNDPILDEYADLLRRLEAANDNDNNKQEEGGP